MKTSQNGINLIKQFEGVSLQAYKPIKSETYWTIGYGHYGADVKQGMTITQAQAEELLRKDLVKFEQRVMKYDSKYHWNENEFSAMVSFAYNLGSIDELTNRGNRTKEQIAQKMLLYNKAGGKELAGLTKRRKLERALFELPVESKPTSFKVEKGFYPKYNGTSEIFKVALGELGIDSTYEYRRKIAVANGIVLSPLDYEGTYDQNVAMFMLLKQGKLKKA